MEASAWGIQLPPGTKMNWTEKGEGEKKKRGSGFRGDQERRFGLNLKGGKEKIYIHVQ